MIVDSSPNEAACLWNGPHPERDPSPGFLGPSTGVEKHTEAESRDDRTYGFSGSAKDSMADGQESGDSRMIKDDKALARTLKCKLRYVPNVPP